MAILVFDMGGSAVKYGVWSQDSLVSKGKFSTPNTWEEMKAQLQQVRTSVNEEIEGVGISAPGAVNAQARRIDGISAIPYIHGFDIYSELEAAFGVPVTIENDANCAGMAEFYQGAGKEFQQAAFVVVGTGVGGTLFQNGELVRGAHLYGGEFGLMILDQGKTFSQLGTAVQMAWRYCDRIGVDRATITGEEVFQRAEDGDAIAIEEVNKFYRYLAQGLFSIQFAFDPEVIIIGGGVSAKKGLLQEVDQRLKKMLADQALNDFVPLIKLCDYRNDANLVGAAANFQALYPRNSR
ncbi:ROK family protein [Enterococcus innesii]|uniref:ROK family protein n=1 Tax=Enterococcus innesii TaxID=2839759 RepID=UPI0034A34240